MQPCCSSCTLRPSMQARCLDQARVCLQLPPNSRSAHSCLVEALLTVQARCQEASSKADRAEREAKRAKLDHKAALTGAQAMQARMGDYQDKIEQLQSQHSHHQLKHDQQLM